MTLILASSSPIRRQMLEDAGADFSIEPASVDEASEKARHLVPETLASALAAAKAQAVSEVHRVDWVIGSDSVVTAGGRTFDKPRDRNEAADHLRFFSGKRMILTSAVALARDGQIDWSCCDSATLNVRPLSDSFIEQYLDLEWPDVACCVGVFRLEGRGVQLFDSIDGNYFTVLGMPLLPLLRALRERGLMRQ